MGPTATADAASAKTEAVTMSLLTIHHIGWVEADMSVTRASLPNAKQVLKLRILPSNEQVAALEETLRVCNEAASWLSQQMHAARVYRKYDVQKRFYTELRVRFGLAAQPTIRVIGKVADAYTTLRANTAVGDCGPRGSQRRAKVLATAIRFCDGAAQPFDARASPGSCPT